MSSLLELCPRTSLKPCLHLCSYVHVHYWNRVFITVVVSTCITVTVSSSLLLCRRTSLKQCLHNCSYVHVHHCRYVHIHTETVSSSLWNYVFITVVMSTSFNLLCPHLCANCVLPTHRFNGIRASKAYSNYRKKWWLHNQYVLPRD